MPPATRFVATVVAVASMLATPALAQDDEYDRKLAGFAAAINQPIKKGKVDGVDVPLENSIPKAGYYRVVVKRTTPALLPAERNKFCSDGVRQIAGGGAVEDFIFDSKYDMGVSLVVNLDNLGAAEPAGAGPAAKDSGNAELLLFRITKAGGRCDFRPTFFDNRSKDAVFELPWRPVDRFAPNLVQSVRLSFRPWLSVIRNEARLGLLDGLLSDGFGLFNLKALFGDDGKADIYGVKAQGRSLFEGFDTELKADQRPALSHLLTYSPGTSVPAGAKSIKPEKIEFTWEFKSRRNTSQPASSYKIGYSIEIEYRSSQVSSTGEFVDMSGKGDADFQTLLANAADPTGTEWSKTSDIKNLLDQNSISDIGVACALTVGRLRDRGLSQDDQALLLYAAARAKQRFSSHEIGTIKCFSDPVEGTRIRSSLATWQIKLDTPRQIPELAQIGGAFERISEGFSRPGTLKQNANKERWMGHHLAESVLVSGAGILGADKNGAPILADGAYSSDKLIETFSRLPPGMRTDCGVWSTNMALPALSNASALRALAFLARRGGEPMLVVIGFDEMNGGYARSSVIYAVTASNLSREDEATAAILEEMKAKCAGKDAYTRLVEAMNPKPAAPAGQTVARGATAPAVEAGDAPAQPNARQPASVQ